MITTSLFSRMTPVQGWNYPVWIAAALLAGMLAATFVTSARNPVSGGLHAPADEPSAAVSGGALGGGLLSFLAVGCPICNKVVVAVIGVSGALTWFAPAQPTWAGSRWPCWPSPCGSDSCRRPARSRLRRNRTMRCRTMRCRSGRLGESARQGSQAPRCSGNNSRSGSQAPVGPWFAPDFLST